MSIKKIFFKQILLLVLLSSSNLFSQVIISGQIKDEKNDSKESVEIQIQNKQSIVVKSELTNKNGNFFIEIEKGEYTILVKQLGNILYQDKVIANQNIDLGIIKIKSNSIELNEVVVKSKKKIIERKVDRLIFNVENSISANGGDAVDALKITPAISVQNDKISIIGKNQLSVMINNRLVQVTGDDLINYLKTIRSDEIKNIEVISNPSSKYDAEGNSGIININLKKAKPNAWSSTFRSSYRQSTYPTGSIGNGFNYQKNKITLLSNINYTKGSNYTTETQEINYPTQNWNGNDGLRNYANILNGKLGFDYKINTKVAIGMHYIGGISKPNIEQNNSTKLSNSFNNDIERNIETNLFNSKRNSNHSLNLHTQYEMDTIGRKINLDFDYFNYKRNNDQTNSTYDYSFIDNVNTYTTILNKGKQDIENYSVRIEMEHPLKWINIEYGGKISFTKTNSNINFFDVVNNVPYFVANRSNQFEYIENNQAIFISGTKKFWKDKLEIQFGLRLENTQTKGYSLTLNQENKTNYSKLFPTSYISFYPNENHTFSFNYGKRINRPKYHILNPFREYSNPFSYIEGNPFLQPSITHNISFDHTFKNNLNTSIYYSYEENGFSSITLVDQNSINQITTNLNYYKSQNVGINESYTFNLFEQWESYNSGSIYYRKTTSNNPSVQNKIEGYGAFVATSNSFIFNKSKTFLGNLDLSYSFPNTVLNFRNQSEFSTNFGFKYLMLNKLLVMSFTFNDIFKTSKQRWFQTINDINLYNTNYEDVRKFTFSLSYKFGNNKLRVKDSKEGNSEEKGRATN